MEQIRVKLPSGIELDVVDTGLPDGVSGPDAETLIFLHGFPESHRTWRNQIAHFQDRYRCVAPDQRGYCGSSNPQEPAMYTIDKLMGDIAQMADALDVGKFTLVGHDLGGVVAWAIALTGMLEGRLERLVVANAPHPLIFSKLLYLNADQRGASQYVRAFRDPANDALVREHGIGAILRKALNWEGSTMMDPAEMATLLGDWSNPDTAIAMLNWYRAGLSEVPPMDAPYELPADYAPPALPKVAVPTLVVWAMDDMALPPANLDGLDELVDDLTLVKVEGCGHFVTWEAPEKFNAAMEEFLAESS